MEPDRIVIGHESNEAGIKAQTVMREVYATSRLPAAKFMDGRALCKFTKYAANAMLAAYFVHEWVGQSRR